MHHHIFITPLSQYISFSSLPQCHDVVAAGGAETLALVTSILPNLPSRLPTALKHARPPHTLHYFGV